MDTIKGFTITGMTISGFKSYAGPTEIQFGDPTVITGGNGRGKSSIADAIAFAVLGLPFFGERGIDRLCNEESGEIFISLRFLDENGVAHELTRTRANDRTSLTFDGREVRQYDLGEMFGEKEVFLSIFNPLYFIEELGEEGRKLLERYLPSIPAENVLAELSESARTALTEDMTRAPDFQLKKVREDIREQEKNIVYLTGQKDFAESQRAEAQSKISVLTQALDDLRADCERIEARRFDGLDLTELQERLADLSAHYEEMSREAPETADTSELDRELQEAHRKLDTRSAERYEPKYTAQIAETQAKITELARRYKRESAVLSGFRAGTVCPTCRRAVTEKELPSVKAELQKAVNATLAEGKSQRAQLTELEALEKQTAETFSRFQSDDMQKLNAEIADLERKRAAAIDNAAAENERRGTELDTLLNEIRSLSAEVEYGSLPQDELNRLERCGEAIRAKTAELDAAQTIVDSAMDDYEAQIKSIESEITEKKELLNHLASFIAKRTELTLASLSMNRVKISLFDVVKSTGEVKDVFKFTYNGRRYDRLSLSEKIRAGMEVSELMKRLTGRNYPVFVDNMESVDDLANVRPTGQVIMAKCVHGAALSIRPAGKPQQADIPQAA